ncbi:MAG: hypothetical protein MUF53_11470 [Gemmatimonadaceae bacterium]|jgi:hypothetical protein|nr:hypothetical protein [Gemmatimonadaceae bacterium]
MPSTFDTIIESLVTTHPFFTTWVGASVSADARRVLARKLFLYEARGRPVNSRAADLARIDAEVTLFTPRPQIGLVRDRVVATLDRFAAPPYVAGERLLRSTQRFPAIYWGARGASGIQWGFVRDIIRVLSGLTVPGGPSVSPADIATYATLATRVDDGYANTDRARLIAKYNAADLDPSLPEVGLAFTPLI